MVNPTDFDALEQLSRQLRRFAARESVLHSVSTAYYETYQRLIEQISRLQVAIQEAENEASATRWALYYDHPYYVAVYYAAVERADRLRLRLQEVEECQARLERVYEPVDRKRVQAIQYFAFANRIAGILANHTQLYKDRYQPIRLVLDEGSSEKKAALTSATATTSAISKIDLKHLFYGEINNKGDAVGFHYRGSIGHVGKARIIESTRSVSDKNGVYTAKVQIFDTHKNKWVNKVARSSFFPDHWSYQKVLDEIRIARANAVFSGRSHWEGVSSDGVRIEGTLRPDGSIRNVHPITERILYT